MKVVSLSVHGVKPARLACMNYPHSGTHLAFIHGISDVIIIPVFVHDGWNYNLVSLIPEEDKYILIRNGDNSTADEYLVLWSLSPEILGDVNYAVEGDEDDDCNPCPAVGYAVEGNAKIVAKGYDADGCTPCPIVHVTGPCRLFWCRAAGLCDNYQPFLEAVFDGKDWIVRPINDERSNSCDIKSTAD